jgi:hypothetical protein
MTFHSYSTNDHLRGSTDGLMFHSYSNTDHVTGGTDGLMFYFDDTDVPF